MDIVRLQHASHDPTIFRCEERSPANRDVCNTPQMTHGARRQDGYGQADGLNPPRCSLDFSFFPFRDGMQTARHTAESTSCRTLPNTDGATFIKCASRKQSEKRPTIWSQLLRKRAACIGLGCVAKSRSNHVQQTSPTVCPGRAYHVRLASRSQKFACGRRANASLFITLVPALLLPPSSASCLHPDVLSFEDTWPPAQISSWRCGSLKRSSDRQPMSNQRMR